MREEKTCLPLCVCVCSSVCVCVGLFVRLVPLNTSPETHLFFPPPHPSPLPPPNPPPNPTNRAGNILSVVGVVLCNKYIITQGFSFTMILGACHFAFTWLGCHALRKAGVFTYKTGAWKNVMPVALVRAMYTCGCKCCCGGCVPLPNAPPPPPQNKHRVP